ncbi:hypothetical protein BOTBODRAFT_59497 [Botryobasidium botryosum FD-172 SS1]|uniref:Oxidoreductase-like domain-containing protein n=1 Tax=Botryobasidium botryosum (strain FD-172 SS1) TaxID=930990 RepID=A0A067M0D9_BOTB1|nr:hypothetical protein BOTBODRAFT_59497 [Botryobasidium botryosum FD-172 SS1]
MLWYRPLRSPPLARRLDIHSTTLRHISTSSHGVLPRPRRGGRNLSARYQLSVPWCPRANTLNEESPPLSPQGQAHAGASAAAERIGREKDHYVVGGVSIPVKPKEPESDECCMSGCAVCVYDLYESTLEDYRDALASAHRELISKGVSRDLWPEDIKLLEGGKNVARAHMSPAGASMDAFKELERRLQDRDSDNR